MATRKTGPVKPPVLDLKARKTPAPKASTTKASTAKATTPKSDAQKTPAGSGRRKAGSVKPAISAKPAPAKSTPAKPADTVSSGADPSTTTAQNSNTATPPPRSAPTPAKNSLTPMIAAIIGVSGGALLGIIVTIALLMSGLLQPLMPKVEDPRLNTVADRVGISEEQITEALVGFNALDDQMNTLRLSADQQSTELQSQLQSQLDELAQILSTLQDGQNNLQERQTALASRQEVTQSEAPIAFDPAPLQTKIETLSARIDAIAAGASTDGADKISEDLTKIRIAIETLENRVLGLDERTIRAGETLVSVQELSANNAESLTILEEGQSSETGNLTSPVLSPTAVRLPLALMGIETALENGRPFATELQSLSGILPEMNISPTLLDRSATGLLRPDELVSRFNAVLPQMLAARPGDPDAGWQQNLWERIKSLVALRSTGEAEGNDIDALISRAEAAVNRRDFVTASEAISLLPAAMRAPLGDLADQFMAFQQTQDLLVEARTLALTQVPESGVAR